MRLKGKTAIVTGGTSGIGKGIAAVFLSEGASVVITGKNAQKGEKAAGDLGGNVTFLQVDMQDPESVNRMVSDAVGILGKLDILVNNAGIPFGKGIDDETVEEWDALINTNVNGYARCTRACLPYLKESHGNILNTSSLAGLRGMSNSFGYCTTKGAIFGMTKNLAIDLAKYGIRVNALLPGFIVTENLRDNLPNSEQVIKDLDAAHPLGRAGTPEDCGYAALYLCSDEAAFITGVGLEVDGGITLGYSFQLV